MRGLPFSVNHQDILLFFSHHAIIQDSIKLGKNSEGRITGEGCCLFESPTECKNAMQAKQGQHIGSRWVELYQFTYDEYCNFNQTQLNRKSVYLSTYITESN